MEKELTELFETVKKAADVADNSPGEEDRCVGALKQLKKFPVNYQVLVSTQVGKRLRQLTKHKNDRIRVLASDVVEMWKSIIVEETMKKKNGSISNDNSVNGKPSSGADTNEHETMKKKSGSISNDNSVNGKPSSGADTNEHKKFQRSNSITTEQKSTAKNVHLVKSEASSSLESEKVAVVLTTKNESGEHSQVNMKVKEKASFEVRVPASDPIGPPKLTSLVLCKDSSRDKVREIIAEALCKVSNEVDDDSREKADICDPFRLAVLVETALFEKWGKSNGAQKFKYRSIVFNIKDPNNPDFRRKVLLGDIKPYAIPELTAEEMASDDRQSQNEKIKEKALFNSQLGGPPKASTNEFTCGRCKKKETTYYQLQTRSADEPMTTFVTCVNCNKRWKF